MQSQPQRLAAWLASSSAPTVERTLETHLSIVLLADHVYKIRKPVQFPFIDQRTPALRYAAAVREMGRGVSFSPQLYVGIHFLTDDGYLTPAGACPDEPVLVMRRVPEQLCAARILPSADAATIGTFAEGLAEMHARLPCVPPEEVIENIRYAWDGNYQVMIGDDLPVPARELARLHREAMQHFEILKSIIVQRAAAGYARMGHGDLRLDHIFLTRPLSLIDPLDYDPRLYRTDVLAELAFLIMELRAHEHYQVASRLAATYAERSGQGDIGKLLEFFVSYRAFVRAKVEWLRHRQVEGGEQEKALAKSRHLIALAQHTLARLSC